MNIIKQKRKYEKRRRNQIYSRLNYFLNLITLGDFFSPDLLKIISFSNLLSQFDDKQTKTDLNYLIFSFFCFENSATEIIKNKTDFSFEKYSTILNKNFSEKEINIALEKINSNSLSNSSNISTELNYLLNFASIFTFDCLKTPIISTKIFFLYILNYLYFLKYPKSSIKNSEEHLKFLVQRFCFLKEIYKEEAFIRHTIDINQMYFAYLLKIYLSELEFKNLVDTKSLKSSVRFFRNNLISKVLKTNLFPILNNDIYKNINNLKNLRQYKF